MRLDLFLALRFLREGRAQTALIVGGTAVGVAVFFFLNALVAAVERGMVAQTLDALPHVVLRPRPEAPRTPPSPDGAAAVSHVQRAPQRLRAVDQWQAVAREVSAAPGVRAVAAVASGPAMASRGEASRSVSLIGVDPEAYRRVLVALPGRVVEGDLRLGPSEVVVGIELAEELGLTRGDTLRVATAAGARAFVVAGLFDLGTRDQNLRWVLTAYRSAQALHALPGASALEVRLDDAWAAAEVADRLRRRTGLRVESWMDLNGRLLAALRSQRGSTRAIQAFVGLAAVAGIASVLVVSVVQRQRQIGILRAMGLSRGGVQRLFLVQGAVIGLLGAAAGVAIGSVLALVFETSARHPDGTPLYPVQLSPALYAASALLALGAGLAAAFTPARRAARLDPAEAIRRD
ncbi:ABC transporter permease [Anaeromyxobacter sp. PSR-1]|uniref:ABC transporter permease n=1 Tax=Anaeromyxobacter sp. PSR-1 TaxID=1300915 RepID=UPI0005E51D2F|nr:ABC transporter permease [Anaeromyxobacter sp. PSR-1]GAO04376.1 lipoprotein-releasing system transmembrane protein LolC [Anaeromyxobacter sp. PSR-1]